MDITGISNVLKLRPKADLEKAAEQMQKHPEAAVSALGQLLNCIRNEASEHGVGFTGQDSLDANAWLQHFAGSSDGVARMTAAPKADLVQLLQYMRPLGKSFRTQMQVPTDDPARIELLQKMASMTDELPHFNGPEKPSDP